MSASWLRSPEKSFAFLLRLMRWAALTLGRRVTHLFIYPISFYYLCFTIRSRRASKDYLEKVLQRKVTAKDIFKHYHTFGCVLLDRVYMVSGQHQKFDVRIHGHEILEAYLAQKQGCILLGSHLGCFETLRSMALKETNDIPIKVLMRKDISEKYNSFLYQLNPNIAQTIIEVGSSDSFIKAKDYLEQGYMIGMLGDRVLQKERAIPCEFLGAPALFPISPFLVASLLKAPVILFFGLYGGGNRYDIYFELLSEDMYCERPNRDEKLAVWLKSYVKRLEHYARLAPYNWFNFYNFWSEDKDQQP